MDPRGWPVVIPGTRGADARVRPAAGRRECSTQTAPGEKTPLDAIFRLRIGREQRPTAAPISVLYDFGQRLGLFDPGGDFRKRREAADQVSGRVGLGHGLSQVGRIAMSQLDGRVDTGDLEQVRVLGTNALDAIQIDAIDPLENEGVRDSGGHLEVIAALRLCALLEQLVGCLDPDGSELLDVYGTDSFDVGDVHSGSSDGAATWTIRILTMPSRSDYAP